MGRGVALILGSVCFRGLPNSACMIHQLILPFPLSSDLSPNHYHASASFLWLTGFRGVGPSEKTPMLDLTRLILEQVSYLGIRWRSSIGYIF